MKKSKRAQVLFLNCLIMLLATRTSPCRQSGWHCLNCSCKLECGRNWLPIKKKHLTNQVIKFLYFVCLFWKIYIAIYSLMATLGSLQKNVKKIRVKGICTIIKYTIGTSSNWHRWDLFSFAYWEVPKAFLFFFPFELLYAWQTAERKIPNLLQMLPNTFWKCRRPWTKWEYERKGNRKCYMNKILSYEISTLNIKVFLLLLSSTTDKDLV